MDHSPQERFPRCSAVLLMGGIGTRFGSEKPKQFHKLSGKPIYVHTMEKFLETPYFAEMILVVPSEWMDEVDLSSLSAAFPIRCIAGGATRQESSYLGLLACDSTTEFVVIHDAVRPFVSKKILLENLLQVQVHHAVDTCIPSTDTLVYSPDGEEIQQIPQRREFQRGQTPQSFSYPLILQAHAWARKQKLENSTDDCSLVLHLGHPVHIVQGEEKNLKITTELDLFLAEQLLRISPQSVDSCDVLSVSGKIYAITGGTGDIGSAIASLLQKAGAQTILLSKSSLHYPIDLTDPESTKKIFEKIHETHGEIDGLINSIGSFSKKGLLDLSIEEINQIIATNLTSLIYCSQSVRIKKGGHIVNIASSSYAKGRKESLIYSAAKAAVVNFSQGLAEAMPDLFVNVLVPQRTNTKMRRTYFPEEELSSLLDPEEIAEVTLRLLQSSQTGSIIDVRKRY